jgi:hypothetical protein
MAKTKEELREYHNKWRRDNRRKRGLQKQGRKPNTEEENIISKENRKEWEKIWKKEYFTYKPQKRLIWASKKRAKEKGLEFSITEEDIIIPEICPYLQTPFTYNARRGTDRRTVMTLDRIDTTKGYIKGNVEVISHLANTMKSNATEEELILFAKHILEKFDDC